MIERDRRFGCFGFTCGAPAASACVRVDNRRAHFVLDVDESGGGPGGVPIDGSHRGQHVAHASRFLALRDESRPVLFDEAVPAIPRDLAGGNHRHHAGKRRRTRRVDADDARSGVRRQRHRSVQQVRPVEVRHVGPVAERRPDGVIPRQAVTRLPRRPGARGSPRRDGREPSARSRRRSSCSRCNGRGGRRSRGRYPTGSAMDWWSSRCLARRAMPGMQKPHCTPAAAANARENRSPILGRQPFEGQDFLAARRGGGHRARHLRVAVHEREAAPALPLRRAPVFQRPDPAALPQGFEERLVLARLDAHRFTVEPELDVHRRQVYRAGPGVGSASRPAPCGMIRTLSAPSNL